MERMRDELGRAGRRGRRILTPDGVVSPMDHNPTIEVSAAVIADCVAASHQFRRDQLRRDEFATPGAVPLFDQGMRDAAAGRSVRDAARDTA